MTSVAPPAPGSDTAAGTPAAPRATLRILVADDFAMARQFLDRHLQRLGAACDHACDGKQAIEAMTRTGYDLLLLDLSMPGVDGFDVIRWLRSGACPFPVPHIAVISALAMESKPALDALGVATLMPKPVRRAELEALLNQLCSAADPQ